MAAKSEPTTWRILPTKDGQFQWAVLQADQVSGSQKPAKTLVTEEEKKSKSRLPSMKDLLLQAEDNSYLPNQQLVIPRKPGVMFSTGSGRTISVQESSIRKARSLIEEEDVSDQGIAPSFGEESFPMFRTGLGKSVQVRQSSINKASALLKVTHDKNGNLACKDTLPDHSMHEQRDIRSACPPLKFHTAGGQSISISADALKRARNLLSDPESEAVEGEAKANAQTCFTSENDKTLFEMSSLNHLCSPLKARITSSALPNQVDFKNVHHSSNNGSCSKFPNEDLSIALSEMPCSRIIPGSGLVGALVDISNCNGSNLKNKSWINGEKKRLGKERSTSSFKKPRTSRFAAPLNDSSLNLAATVEPALPSTSVNSCCRTRVSSRYPFHVQRKKLKEFFGSPPGRLSVFENVPDRVRCMTSDNAEKYRFRDSYSSIEFGPEKFQEMLLQHGALPADTNG